MLKWVHLIRVLVAGALLRRLSAGRRRRPPLRPGTLPPPRTTISVVVPARDEATRLAPCLAGLAADGDVLEVLVVDDESTDATAAVARAGGARVVAGAPRPAGWAGKTWALQQGLREASGDVVVFLDADARPRPGLCAGLARTLTDLDLVSAIPAWDSPAPALHAALAVTIPLRVGPGDSLLRSPPAHRVVANGQCLAVRREALERAGGWSPVRGHMTEDVALARVLAARGWRVGMVDASALLTVRPYESAAGTLRGWSRSLMGSDVNAPADLALDLATLWIAQAAPLLRVLTRSADPLDVALLAVRLGLNGALRGPASAPLYDPLVVARLTWSVLRPDRTWRGRTYGGRTARR